MARRERGLVRMILNDFIESLAPQFNKRKLIGEDFYGTKYFETAPRKGSYKKAARHFVPVNKVDFMQELPAEWEAWLRYRRREPPTKEEIEKNYKMILMKQENAAALAEAHVVKEEVNKLPPSNVDKEIAQNPGGFPSYKEYQNFGMAYQYPKKE